MSPPVQLLAIDAATHSTGLAIFDIPTRRLQWAGLVVAKSDNFKARSHEMSQGCADAVRSVLKDPGYKLVSEYPRVYPRSPADPNDLIMIALVLGGIRNQLPRPGQELLPHPGDWHQIKKDIMQQKTVKALLRESGEQAVRGSELSLLLPFARRGKYAFQDDVGDAVGIGLWALGRLE